MGKVFIYGLLFNREWEIRSKLFIIAGPDCMLLSGADQIVPGVRVGQGNNPKAFSQVVLPLLKILIRQKRRLPGQYYNLFSFYKYYVVI